MKMLSIVPPVEISLDNPLPEKWLSKSYQEELFTFNTIVYAGIYFLSIKAPCDWWFMFLFNYGLWMQTISLCKQMASVFKAKHFRLFSTISYFMPETIFLRKLFGLEKGKREWLFRRMCAKEGCICYRRPARHMWMGCMLAYPLTAQPKEVNVLYFDCKDFGFPVGEKDIFDFLMIGLVAYL